MAKKNTKKSGGISTAKKKVVTPTVSKTAEARKSTTTSEPLLFNKTNFMYMAIGAGLILLGMVMMLGGKQPDPNTWDPNIIYSKRITILAPFLILSGLVVEIFAIFKK